MLSFIKSIFISLNRISYWRHLNKHNKKTIQLSKRVIVFESDDWGSIRIPSKKTFDSLISKGEQMSKDPFLKYDCLENKDDVCALMDTLSKFKDLNGRAPIFTLNFAVSNPDFDKIDAKKGIFAREDITKTYSDYYHDNILSYINEGISAGLFKPQLHCMEHLRSYDWIENLSKGDESLNLAYDFKMIGVYSTFDKSKYGYMDELNYSQTYFPKVCDDLKKAANMFEKLFGFRSISFTPPCFVWKEEILPVLYDIGIRFIQCGIKQYYPLGGDEFQTINHFTGEVSEEGIIFTTRNCFLEPVFFKNYRKAVRFCLRQIKIAFKNNAPAIIDTHRANYVGSIDVENRERGNRALSLLIKCVLKKYPNVCFMSSTELQKHILEKVNKL